MTADTSRYQAFTISITPFAEDGSIDEAKLRRHLSKLGDAGIGVYVGGGGSGEGYTLSADETRASMRRRSIRSTSAMAMSRPRANSTPISAKCCRTAMCLRSSRRTSRSAM